MCIFPYDPQWRLYRTTVRSTDLKDNEPNEPYFADEPIQPVHRLGSGAGGTVTCSPPTDCTNKGVLTVSTSTSNSSTTNTTADAVRIPFSSGLRKSVWLNRLHSASTPLATAVGNPHQVNPQAVPRRLRRAVKIPASTVPMHIVLAAGLPVSLLIVVCTLFCHMVPHRGGPTQAPMQRKTDMPPAWGPENENHQSFAAWSTEIALWSMSSDLIPSKQASKIVYQGLTGAARDAARTLTRNELLYGGVINGEQLDPVGYLLKGLEERFGQLDDEQRLAAMTEFQAFARYPGETINAVLSRYANVRQRAQELGNFVQSIEACALQLLRACSCSPTQLMQFTAPFNGRMPSTEGEFLAMQANMRRVGHILEHSPNNIAQSLLPPRQAKPGAYMASETEDVFMADPSPADTRAQPVTDWTYLGQAPNGAPRSYSPGQHNGQGQPQHGESSSSDATGTDTDTSSDSGNEQIDMSDVAGLTAKQAEAKIFWQYREHKRKWRRFTNKPVRKFRRHVKRFKKTRERKDARFRQRQVYQAKDVHQDVVH